MLHQARFKLTLFYSLIFLSLFWSLSFGVYYWMNGFFGDKAVRSYSRFEIRYDRGIFENGGTSEEPFSDVVMDRLKFALLVVDLGLFIIIPLIMWLLTGKTLEPVQKAHDKEKQFLTDVSHDLRTPLSVLKAEIELVLQKKHSLDEYIKTLRSNREEVEELIYLVESMIFFARIDKGYQSFGDSTVDLTDLLVGVVGTFQKNAREKNIKLSFNPSDKSIVVLGNLQILKRLFVNLIDNAIKYTEVGGSVVVTLKSDKKLAIISVADSGIGILPEDQSKIFDRFYRVDSSRSEKGYGLGLSIVKQIIEYLGGTISLYSSPKKGSTFIVRLPLP